MQFHTRKAIYLQISDYVCEQILTQHLRSESRLPSVRDMAIELQVNPNTVMRTYAFLEKSQIISMRRGVGYFITENAHKEVLKLKKNEFNEMELPRIFKLMDLLEINFSELKKLYDARKVNENE